MTQPPDYLAEWLVIISTGLGVLMLLLPRLRRWVLAPMLNPVLQVLREHENAHAVAARAAEIVMRELVANGSEELLPEDERNRPLRNLAVRNRIGVLRIEGQLVGGEERYRALTDQHTEMALKLDEHMEFSDRIVQVLNEEREQQGQPPLEERR